MGNAMADTPKLGFHLIFYRNPNFRVKTGSLVEYSRHQSQQTGVHLGGYVINTGGELSPDASRNQKESNRAIFGPELNLTSEDTSRGPRAVANSTCAVTAFLG
jgi:hypothetical protein